jgi:hypothetical protein
VENCLRLTLSLGFSATKLFNENLRQAARNTPFPRCVTFPMPTDNVRRLKQELEELGFDVIIEQRDLQPFVSVVWHDNSQIDRLMEL